jgi:hypothetical protein
VGVLSYQKDRQPIALVGEAKLPKVVESCYQLGSAHVQNTPYSSNM